MVYLHLPWNISQGVLLFDFQFETQVFVWVDFLLHRTWSPGFIAIQLAFSGGGDVAEITDSWLWHHLGSLVLVRYSSVAGFVGKCGIQF